MNSLNVFIILLSAALIGAFRMPSENPEERAGLFEGDIAGVDVFDVSKGAYQIPTIMRGLWPNGQVAYTFDSGAAFTSAEKNEILGGMKLIEDGTRINGKNCITFTPRTNQGTYIKFIRGNGCYSYIGKKFLSGPQDLSLGEGCVHPIVAAHELIHALGWYHEQARPDRDDYITVHTENIQKGMENQFSKLSTSQVGQMDLPYDYDSIMHYPPHAFSSNGKDTIVPKKAGVTIGQRSHVSEIDIREIRAAYKCV